MPKIRWGVLGTAKIALEKVIPAMQQGQYCDLVAIASRDPEKARGAAQRLELPRSHGSYEALLADPEVDAVYNPLPNHLHVPWSIRALQAGKHVLCEKPIGLSSEEARKLLAEAKAHPDLKAMEAFMYRFHPQWREARRIVREGGVGPLQTIQSFFSYFNDDPDNIRNRADWGGGGLMDIGCYPISLSRFIFDSEPRRVLGWLELDPRFGIDRLASATLEFDTGTATFTCATQLAPYQRVHIFGTEGSVEIEIPFNAPHDRPCRIWHQRAGQRRAIDLPVANQYTLQGDRFSQAVLEDRPVPTPLEDALANMQVIEAVVQSHNNKAWAEVAWGTRGA